MVADGRTIDPRDLIPCDVIYPDRCGENYEVLYNRTQRWIYFSNMTTNEALIFKGYDSCLDSQARIFPHSSFDHPDTDPSTPNRGNIEVRMLAIV